MPYETFLVRLFGCHGLISESRFVFVVKFYKDQTYLVLTEVLNLDYI